MDKSELHVCVGKVTAAKRWGTRADIVAAEQTLHETQLRVAIRKTLESAPPLSAEQRARLAQLLAPQASDSAAA